MSDRLEAAGVTGEFPDQIIVDPEKGQLAIFVSMDQGLFGPQNMIESFSRVDASYKQNEAAKLRAIGASSYTIERTDVHRPMDVGVAQDERDAYAKDITIVTSPLNDGRPLSPAQQMYYYVAKSSVNKWDRERAKPDSWFPAVKLDTQHEFMHAEGVPMAYAQVYAREAPALTRQERRDLAHGDRSAFGRLAIEALREANRRKKQEFGTDNYERVHLFGAGMGEKAVAAALYMLDNGYNVASVTLMNTGLEDEKARKLLNDYARHRTIGPAAGIILPAGYAKQPEPKIRRDIFRRDSEYLMYWRMVRALADLSISVGHRDKAKTGRDIEALLERGVVVSMANALNESMLAGTDKSLPQNERLFHYSSIVGVDGKETAMLTNQQAAVVAVVAANGFRNWRDTKAA